MVDSAVNRSKQVLIALLERQECCDISFNLKDQVVIKGHSHILSAHTSKFSCEYHDFPLMFDMDSRIDYNTMWNVLRYMYIREDFDINVENLDSFVILAYFFLDPSLMANADNLLFKTISVSSAFDILHYAINMNMSYNCKERIYEYINGNVLKWPENYTLDAILMYPHILSTIQNEHFGQNMVQGAALVPMIANNAAVEVAGNNTGEPSMAVDGAHSNIIPIQAEIIAKPIEAVGNSKQDQLYDEIEEQLDVVGGSDFDPLFEQIHHKLQGVQGNQDHEALYAQIEGLLDVVGVFENEAAALRSNMNDILYGTSGPSHEFN